MAELSFTLLPLKLYISFGLAHLTLTGGRGADEMLACSRALLKRYRAAEAAYPVLELRIGARTQLLEGNHPLAPVATALFGGAAVVLSPHARDGRQARLERRHADRGAARVRRAARAAPVVVYEDALRAA